MFDKTSTFVCVVLGATLATAPAFAQPATEPEAVSSSSGGPEGVAQVTLPKGRVLLDAYFAASLNDSAVFKPFSLSPDVWYGATDELTVGLVHSSVGGSGFMGGAGTSLCLAGTAGNCSDVYKGFGVDARYKLKTGMLAYAAEGGVYVNTFDPFAMAIKLGLVARWQQDKIAVETTPNVTVGVVGRTTTVNMVDVTTNGEFLNLPVTGMYAITPQIAAALQTGAIVPFEETADTWSVPLSIGGFYHVNESINVNLAFSLPKLLGGGEGTGVDARSLTLGGSYAF
jgi:hypothetical protein